MKPLALAQAKEECQDQPDLHLVVAAELSRDANQGSRPPLPDISVNESRSGEMLETGFFVRLSVVMLRPMEQVFLERLLLSNLAGRHPRFRVEANGDKTPRWKWDTSGTDVLTLEFQIKDDTLSGTLPARLFAVELARVLGDSRARTLTVDWYYQVTAKPTPETQLRLITGHFFKPTVKDDGTSHRVDLQLVSAT